MSRLSSSCVAIVSTLTLLISTVQQSANAQTNPWEIPKPGTYQGSVEIQRREQEQQRQQDQKNSISPPAGSSVPRGSASPGPGGSSASVQPTRSVWIDRPALPPARNPLLGRWSQQFPNPSKGGNSLLDALLGGGNLDGLCDMLFSEGTVEFRTASLVGLDPRQGAVGLFDRVMYRGSPEKVIVLAEIAPMGQRSLLELPFEFEGRDRARVVPGGKHCALARVGNAPGGAAAAPASNPPAGAASAASSGGFEVLGVTLGRSNDKQVRDNIAARGARPLIGRTPGTQELRIQVHDRKYGHPQLANVWYDFTDGVLSAVTIIWERDKRAAPALFQQRAEFLSKSLGLGAPQQPSKLVGRAKGAEIVLIDDAAAGLVSESYSVAR